MRIINKKYLLIIILVGVILTGVFLFKPQKEEQLNEVVLKDEVSNEAFAMYKEEGDSYTKIEENKFPDMYVLNLTKSKCIDNNGNEIKDALSYENDKVVLKSNRSSYCYLYFDKSLGEEIKEINPNKLSTAIKGAMYRFQGPAKDESGKELVNNYICFGTSDKEKCTSAPDKYMYRIIGIEAETGRVKVIKKEALNETVQWWDNYDEDKTFPESRIYEALTKFLNNTEYVPIGWENKISDNTWTYGDMLSNDTMGARQNGEELYKVETGQKGTIWDEKAKAGDPGAKPAVVDDNSSSPLHGQTVYYIRHENEKWDKTFTGKVSLMYIHDYHYSVSDDANCQSEENHYDVCKAGWMHLSNNDEDAPSPHEWTMSRYGWYVWGGLFDGRIVDSAGCTGTWGLNESFYIRPVFYINAKEKLEDGNGTITDPFTITE